MWHRKINLDSKFSKLNKMHDLEVLTNFILNGAKKCITSSSRIRFIYPSKIKKQDINNVRSLHIRMERKER